MKADVRARIDIEKAFGDVRDVMDRETELILDAHDAGRSVIPDISFDTVLSGSVPVDTLSEIRRRGCVIIRGVFDVEEAVRWNDEIGEYLEQNDYVERARTESAGDRFFDSLNAGSPQIFGLYWSRPQIAVRQAESMAVTKRFLNNMWDTTAPAGPEFDPDHDYTYADRIRRRAPGDATLELSPHMDSGSFERWVDPAFQKIYEPIFAGAWRDFDPWKAAHRTQTREHASPAVCSVFRTFQGWTALTPQGPNTGTLQLFPVANSIAYPLLRSLQDDVAQDELLLADPGRALGVDEISHPEIVAGIVSIPEVEPGDTVWWHPDITHAVEDVHDGSGYSNVIYVGASPRCAKNLTYVRQQAEHFLTGRSSPDFRDEDFEVDFVGRATIDDLTELGRAQMGL
jgi:hypothetical protein